MHFQREVSVLTAKRLLFLSLPISIVFMIDHKSIFNTEINKRNFWMTVLLVSYKAAVIRASTVIWDVLIDFSLPKLDFKMILLPFGFTRGVHVRFRFQTKENTIATSSNNLQKQFWKSKISISRDLLIKTSMGKPPNKMDNCPFAFPWLCHCILKLKLDWNK